MYFYFQLTLFRMKVQKVQEVLCSGFLDVLRLSSLRSRYLSVYEKVRLLIMKKCPIPVYLKISVTRDTSEIFAL